MQRLKASKKNTKKSNPVPDAEFKQGSNNEDSLTRIAIAAYYKAEVRGYEPGHELQDWLEAEAELKKDQ